MNSNPEAKDLPCFFAFFAKEHKDSDLLKHIEICKVGKWRNASAAAATKIITEIAKYFSELTQYLDSIEHYSLCEGHYNRIVAKKSFIDQLKKKADPILLSLEEPEKKRLKFSNDDVELQVPEKTFVDFGIQVDLFKKACVDFESQVSFLDPILQRRIDELEKII